MPAKTEALAIIKQQGILPMFFNASETVAVNLLKALYKGGMRVIEFTNRGPEALRVFKALKAERDANYTDLLIGTGTIKTVDDAHTFIDAGTDFIVAPGTIAEVGRVTVQAGLLWSPGCMSVTEIMVAEENGSQLVKLFPGSLLSPAYIGAVREIFPHMNFMPTGGVEPEMASMAAWFKAGAVAVGMGGKLVSKHLMDIEHYEAIEERAKYVLEIIADYRQEASH